MTVSFFVQNDKLDNKNSIKFGSYDKIGIKPDTELELIRTVNTSTWDVKANQIIIGDTTRAELSDIRFDPQLPYLYLPRDYYRVFTENINKLYSDQDKYGAEKICNESENICVFNEPCDKVEKKKIEFGIRLYDKIHEFYYNIH